MLLDSKENFKKTFGVSPLYHFAAPGRTELSGNHTDHQHGRVLAAAINLETEAYVRPNGTNIIHLKSEGYPQCEINVTELNPREEEKNTTSALIRGVCAAFEKRGAKLEGFDAYVTSSVLAGSGLSSSAAFEVLIGNILNTLFFDEKCSPVDIAKIGQWAENVYFGKPCGLMDQTASSVGSIISIDFNDPENPVIENIDFDFKKAGYTLFIIDSGADHSDLTDEYAAIPFEMMSVASLFGKEVLREIDDETLMNHISYIRAVCGDRAALRAMHFMAENERVPQQVEALKSENIERFLALVDESGVSSWTLLQNITPCGESEFQAMALTLAMAKKHLGGKGACRVHGGGFAGTVQAFVPNEMASEFKEKMEYNLGKDSCHILDISYAGGRLVETYND